MRGPTVSYSLIILFFLSSILIVSGCAKKVVKESELGAAGEAGEQAMREAGEFKKEVVIGGEDKTSKTEVGKAIEESLKGLETKEPQVGEKPIQPIQSEGEKPIQPMEDEGKRASSIGEELAKPTDERLAALKEIDEMARLKQRLLPVYFDFDKYSIREDEREKLKNNASWLMKNPNLKILIEGHADERGSNEYNLALGDRRALSVANYLKDLGVSVEISTVTFGEERAVCAEHHEGCWSKNRRAEFRIVSE